MREAKRSVNGYTVLSVFFSPPLRRSDSSGRPSTHSVFGCGTIDFSRTQQQVLCLIKVIQDLTSVDFCVYQSATEVISSWRCDRYRLSGPCCHCTCCFCDDGVNCS